MEYITIDSFENTGIVKTICTKKSSLASEGSWKYGEQGAPENYEQLGKLFDITPTDIVRAKQIHSADVRVVTKEENGGDGILRPAAEYDGLITNEKHLLLCTLEADCVPVFLLDPVRKVIGMVHSGWKGTAQKISVNAVNRMKEHFGSRPSDIIAAMGPCICENCYEVSDDLLDPFSGQFSKKEMKQFFRQSPVREDKYFLDLAEAIRLSLMKEGVKDAHIQKPPFCTFHDGIFPSYRKEKDMAGRMLTGIMLTE